MVTTTRTSTTTAADLSQETVETYRRDGFVHVPQVITPEEVAEFRDAALALAERMKSYNANGIFTQLVNAWLEDETMKKLSLHPTIGSLAEKLSGVPLRMWHDQTLIKLPHNKKPTEYHQDQSLWPHDNKHTSISAWVALVDVPVERGCMSFIPGSQRYTDLRAMNLGDGNSAFEVAPDLAWEPRVTIPLRAGDATFHNSRTLHMAGDNSTDVPRVAHIILMMDAETRYRQQGHPVTDPLNLQEGDLLDQEIFPRMPTA